MTSGGFRRMTLRHGRLRVPIMSCIGLSFDCDESALSRVSMELAWALVGLSEDDLVKIRTFYWSSDQGTPLLVF